MQLTSCKENQNVPFSSEWYIVEQETYAHPPLVTVEKCLQNLRAMGK